MEIFRGEICKQMGFFRCRTEDNESRPLINTSKKENKRSKYTREGMAGAKPITLPISAHQIYGEVPAKYATPYFAKLLIAGSKTVRDLPKYEGNLNGKTGMCMHHILKK